jgi:cycloartenol synthase
MWRLRTGQESAGGEPWLRTTNAHAGRQIWEFDPTANDATAAADVDDARREFSSRRHQQRHSADLLLRLQVLTFSPRRPAVAMRARESYTRQSASHARVYFTRGGLISSSAQHVTVPSAHVSRALCLVKVLFRPEF